MATRGQTVQHKKDFLEHFRHSGNVSHACRVVGIARKRVYEWRTGDKRFETDFRTAEIEATENLEQEAYRRAVEGTSESVYQGGKRVGVVQKYSDTLLIFLLKGRAPHKYADRRKIEHSGEVGSGDDLTPEERDRVRRALIGESGG